MQGITIGKKIETKHQEELPGPGAYIDPNSTAKSNIAFTFGEKRDYKIPSTPGPGQYEVQHDEQKGITISGKYSEKAPENLPGPGQYEKKSTLQEGPQYSIGEK